MKITVDMPVVAECDATDCAYNVNSACHARAITIGDGVSPGCDTYFSSGGHAREAKRIAGVGACKVTGCSYNQDFECTTENISVGSQGGLVHCLTFTRR